MSHSNRCQRWLDESKYEPCHLLRRLRMHVGQHVGVGVERDGDAGVPEPLAHGLRRHPGLETGGRGVGVTDVVEPDVGEPGVPGVLLEPRAEQARVDCAPVCMGDDEPGVLPGAAGGEALLGLLAAVALEDGHGRLVEGDRAPALGGSETTS